MIENSLELLSHPLLNNTTEMSNTSIHSFLFLEFKTTVICHLFWIVI